MQRAALDLLRRLPPTAAVIPVQVLGELFNVLVRKGGSQRDKARAAILDWRDSFPLIETSAAVVFAAADLATDHRLSIWDAVILAAAAAGGCRLPRPWRLFATNLATSRSIRSAWRGSDASAAPWPTRMRIVSTWCAGAAANRQPAIVVRRNRANRSRIAGSASFAERA